VKKKKKKKKKKKNEETEVDGSLGEQADQWRAKDRVHSCSG